MSRYPSKEADMSNALNVAATATDIIDALAEAIDERERGKQAGVAVREKVNACTLRGYAVAAVAVRTLIDQGLWTTGKQKKGIVSASSALKDALITQAKAKEVPAGTAKRLIEKAAALVVPGTKAHVPGIFVASANSATEVVKAMTTAGFSKEADIVRHVEPPQTSVVGRLIKAIVKLEGKDRIAFVKELVDHEVIDDVLAEAGKTSAEEREKQRAEAKAAVSNAAAKAAEARKAKQAKAAKEKAAPKEKAPAAPKGEARAVPKSGGSKKGSSTKAKKETGVAPDPFAS